MATLPALNGDRGDVAGSDILFVFYELLELLQAGFPPGMACWYVTTIVVPVDASDMGDFLCRTGHDVPTRAALRRTRWSGGGRAGGADDGGDQRAVTI